jgi:hypothetical protein
MILVIPENMLLGSSRWVAVWQSVKKSISHFPGMCRVENAP